MTLNALDEYIGLITNLRLLTVTLKDRMDGTPAEGLIVREIFTLYQLHKQDGRKPSDLARGLGIEPTSFTPVLDLLERLGFVQRDSHPSDRRAILVWLTDKGQSLRDVILNSVEIMGE